jgi:hypothetical protein
VSTSVEQSLKARATAHAGLNALVSGRFYVDQAPQTGLSTPYVVFWRVSTVIEEAMGAPVSPYKARYQFDLYADSKPNLHALFDQVMSAFHRWMDPTTYNVTDILFENAIDGPAAVVMPGTATQLFTRSIDFMVLYNP